MKYLLTLCALLSLAATSVHAQTAADAYYDPAEMEKARTALRQETGGQTFTFVQADRLEYQTNEGEGVLLWDAQGWIGGDINKFWFKTEGEYFLDADEFEEAEVQALYSRAISPFFDLQVGLRHDITPNPSRTHAVIGIQGLAPYWFEVDAAAFVSDEGEVTARIEAEYELLLTQRLILQPRTELSFAAQDVEELGIGSGLSTVEAGMRLRYEIKREIAPYIGFAWNRKIGDTADFARLEGETVDSLSFVVGLRLWY
ncbi:copper resistance protein B [Luteithermobacter gelatinilyticus]|uniref:copper resistance protein B n=1 Tax=Luteithermobacter gelatinilyticus TaxID=2582913 RepID=UPI001105BF8F|nr:copper resistance protein B [Luteithermobacter gelatinilyticus]